MQTCPGWIARLADSRTVRATKVERRIGMIPHSNWDHAGGTDGTLIKKTKKRRCGSGCGKRTKTERPPIGERSACYGTDPEPMAQTSGSRQGRQVSAKNTGFTKSTENSIRAQSWGSEGIL